LAKESVRDICLTDDSVEAKVLLDEANRWMQGIANILAGRADLPSKIGLRRLKISGVRVPFGGADGTMFEPLLAP
jgi:hypothetical protein